MTGFITSHIVIDNETNMSKNPNNFYQTKLRSDGFKILSIYSKE